MAGFPQILKLNKDHWNLQ